MKTNEVIINGPVIITGKEVIELITEKRDLASTIQSQGKFIKKGKDIAKFALKNHPILSILTASLAVDFGLSAIERRQRNLVKLFAKDPYERRIMKDIVDTLVKTGRFRLKRTRYKDGGQYWLLVRR